jgi:hypothetical protein
MGAVGQQRRGGGRRRTPTAKHIATEDLATTSVVVARFWQGAYDELVRMEEQLLDQLESMLPMLSPAARREAELTNLPMIAEHLQTFKYRRAHWQERVSQLSGQKAHRA